MVINTHTHRPRFISLIWPIVVLLGMIGFPFLSFSLGIISRGGF